MKFSSVKTYQFFAFFSLACYYLSLPVYGSSPSCRLCDGPLPICGENNIGWGHSGYQCGDSKPVVKLFCHNGNYDCWLKPMCGDSMAEQCERLPPDVDDNDVNDNNVDDNDVDDNDDDSQTCPNVKVKINTFPYKTGTIKLRCNNN